MDIVAKMKREYRIYERLRHKRTLWIAGSALFVLWFVITSITLFLPPYDFPSDKIFDVEDGKGLQQISKELKENDVIRSASLFSFLIKLFGHERSIKAGLYYFEQPLSLVDIMYRLTDGNYEVTPFRATIKEGATIYGMGLFFEERGFFSANAFWHAAGLHPDHYGNDGEYLPLENDYSMKSDLVSKRPTGEGLEGFLFPDTYFFPPGVTPEGVVHAMLENFDRKIVPDIRAEIDQQGKSFYDVLIMASIIEREALNGDDGKIISGILWKRLASDYPLQVDAVLSYITGRGSFALSADDLDIDSPYNVYRRIGLPPTPISNPGIEAIEAALYPEETDYWYYLHDAEGRAHYARTFDEHKENKIKYLR
ncbi:MAG: endolytic transglycosylase MltG [Candidatus Niyogibacteria bacterium CG10_big_fil_rev_8_21_14_0_10_46_36]|uniref:Endolytic murein transglycosylase n=1 Tax=Candidatus Niyogibacteria bacterium CG10_big_fil_rev_8_21_14_0_10_46_36 TaxID=1974726 RepID=A0A2H0TCY6_9BACT|nr:MAG: endolytic transglycosylase MltG [Candidatus Niyogibacteria bacterium CG10_big_fil_rev_8_21_14_0_10_46_36]